MTTRQAVETPAHGETPTYRFRSDMFPIDPKEDEETNPFFYGRSLAQWLRTKFRELGHTPEEVIAEDFGWVVVLSRGAGMLWVASVNDRDHFYEQVSPEAKASFVPDSGQVIWNVWVATDKPFWSLNFSRRRAAIQRLDSGAAEVTAQLHQILRSEPRIEFLRQD